MGGLESNNLWRGVLVRAEGHELLKCKSAKVCILKEELLVIVAHFLNSELVW